MKTWLAKFRISAALDEQRPLSARLAKAAASSEELRRFKAGAVKLDAALRASPPQAEPPFNLHSSILRALEAAERPAPAERRGLWLRWLPAPITAVLLVFGLWAGLHHRSTQAARADSLVWVSTALDTSRQLTGSLPNALINPLSEELENLHQDVGNTAQFVLASLP